MKIAVSTSLQENGNVVLFQQERLEFLKGFRFLGTLFNSFPEFIFLGLEYGGSRFHAGLFNLLIHFFQFFLAPVSGAELLFIQFFRRW